MLFKAYILSILLYGGAVWGPSILDGRGQVGEDVLGRLGVFYRGGLHSLLDVGRDVHNAVLYILSARPPLHIYAAK